MTSRDLNHMMQKLSGKLVKPYNCITNILKKMSKHQPKPPQPNDLHSL